MCVKLATIVLNSGTSEQLVQMSASWSSKLMKLDPEMIFSLIRWKLTFMQLVIYSCISIFFPSDNRREHLKP